MGVEQRQRVRRVGSDLLAHAGIEAVVHVGEHQVQMRLGGAKLLRLRDPFGLLARGQIRAEIQKALEPGRIARQTARRDGSNRSCGSKPPAGGTARRTSSFIGVKRAGLSVPSSDSKYSSARFTPSQSNAAHQIAHAGANRRESIPVGQVHQLAPVQLGVLKQRGFFAPLRMLLPELVADVRQLKPGVDQDAVAVAGVDQVAQVFVGLRVGLPVVPRGDVQRGDSGCAPLGREVIDDPRAGGKRNRKRPTGSASGTAASDPDRPAPAADREIARSRGRPGARGHPQHRALASPHAGHQRRACMTLPHEHVSFLAEFRRPRRSASCSQTMSSLGARRSSALRTVTRLAVARKPNDDAAGEPPSTMRMVPCSTRAAQPESSPEATATPSLPEINPREERIAGQAPGASLAT